MKQPRGPSPGRTGGARRKEARRSGGDGPSFPSPAAGDAPVPLPGPVPAPGAGSSLEGTAPADLFSSVGIVGLGLIGGSMALALRKSGFRGSILGVSSARTVEAALGIGAIDRGCGYEALPGAVAECDLVILASPISAIVGHLQKLGGAGDSLSRGTVITDVGSTKRAILAAARNSLPPRVHFIGGHPLAGAETRGIGAADPFLFQNAYYVLTPTADVPPGVVERLAAFLGSTGARVMLLTAEEHDRVAAAISHLPQILAVALVRFLDRLGPDRETAIRLAAGGFRDMTRIASSPYSVWKDIIDSNRDVIGSTLRQFLESVQAGVAGLETGAIEAEFAGASRTRAEIPRDTKGFLRRLWDVLVVVEDRPGIIASIAAPLAEHGININDIEVLKVREGAAGTLRLAFASQDQAREAIEILGRIGYKARHRD